MKILVLILASDTDPIYLQFQSIWRRYMKSSSHIDCYFYKGDPMLETEYKLDEDTLWIRMGESTDTVYEKTLKAFEYFATSLDTYDFVFRPNLSSFVIFDKYIDYCSTLPRQRSVSAFIGGQGADTFPSGSGFTMSPDVVLKLLNDRPLKVEQDDVTIGKWLYSNGIPIQPAARCDYIYGTGIPHYHGGNEADIFHYRIKNETRRLDVEIHEKLLNTFYGTC